MLFKGFGKAVFFLFAAAQIVGCGLVPNLSSGNMNNSERAVLYMKMGERYLELDMLDTAKEKLDTAARLDSGNGEIDNVMGEFYERIKDYPEAEDSYTAAIRKSPGNFDIKSNIGRFWCDRGDYAKGMALLQQALEQPMNNRQWFALTGMGSCYLKQNDLHRAEDYLRQALQQQPDYPTALQEMQKISYQNRQYMSARAFLERYLGVAQHTPETLWIAYQTERALGNGKIAEDYGEQLLKAFPASREAQEIKAALDK